MASDAIYGTLNLLILQTLERSPSHGLAVKHDIERRTDGGLSVEPGALYPALHRLHRDGLVEAEWGKAESGRRAKIYELTGRGREVLAEERARWERHMADVTAVLDTGHP